MIDKDLMAQFHKAWQDAQKILKNDPSSPPKILVGGKTGVGKSSLLNALLGKNVYEIGVIPCTKMINEETWTTPAGEIKVIDVPGFAEAEKLTNDNKDEYQENILKIASLEAHMLLLVLKCDDRALQPEDTFIKYCLNNSVLKNQPIIIAVNQIDKMKPTREWNPPKLNLRTPISEKDKNIRTYLDYLISLNTFSELEHNKAMIPICAGESWDDYDNQYGIDLLKEKIYNLLPDCAKTIFARAAAEVEIRNQEAYRIIKHYSAYCASGVALNFVPMSDSLVLIPIQITMIKKLGDLYGISLSESVINGLIQSIGMSFAGRFVCSTLLSFFPVFKNLVGPPLAFSLTYGMGKIVNELFSKNIIVPTPELVAELANKNSSEVEVETKNFK